MAYTITIRKRVGGFKWVNTYVGNFGSRDAAVAAVPDFVLFEKAIHCQQVDFENAHVALKPDPTRLDFQNVPLSGNGTVAFTDSQVSGAQIILAMRMGTVGGAPGRKQFKWCLGKSDWLANGEGYDIADVLRLSQWDTAYRVLFDKLTSRGEALLVGKNQRETTEDNSWYITTGQTRHGWYNKGPDGTP